MNTYNRSLSQKEPKKNGKKLSLLRVFRRVLLIVLLASSLSSLPYTSGNNIPEGSSSWHPCEYIEKEKTVDWKSSLSLGTQTVYVGGKLYVNYIVLPLSESNVSFTFDENDAYDWSPDPQNFTLAPGESHDRTFALNHSGIDFSGAIIYHAMALQEGKTATVRWGYEVLDEGTYPYSSSGLFLVLLPFCLLALRAIISWNKHRPAKE
ncbi:MAG: hypothetical protein GF308_00530 [Candidatus Heimdallarchaeota archaeon]|nr:hypothetical protein [Candidatus Heimdallarchaeota archaeon]